MNGKKDKQKVLDEVFDDDRIANFLNGEAPDGFNRDFFILQRAYRGMKAASFKTFVQLFQQQGLDLNSPSPEGKSLLAQIEEHPKSAEYADILRSAGAKP